MKKPNLFTMIFLLSGILSVSTSKASGINGYSKSADGDDTIVMGSAYVNDVYYSLKKGITATPPRANWDISFRAGIMSSSILTNGASGVILYAYPKSDTSGWSTLDTSGLSTWKPLYNSVKDWEKGAFMANAGTHPDYGWGVYNNTTHKLYGDSLFVIKLIDGTFRKIWIVEKDSPKNKYYVRYAKLDGTKDTTVIVDCNLYKAKEFVGFSITSNSVVDREPATADWEVLFTKYMDKVSMGPGVYVDYPVMGILTNAKVYVSEVRGVDQQTYEDFTAHPFDSFDISIIGRDWKKSTGQPPVYTIVDTLVYFLNDKAGDIYKLYFKGFEDGSASDGKVMFYTKLIKPNSINEVNSSVANMMVYPNPATASNINLICRFDDVKEFTLDVIDINGKIIKSQKMSNKPGLNTVSLSEFNLEKGLYIARISTGKNILSSKFIITE